MYSSRLCIILKLYMLRLLLLPLVAVLLLLPLSLAPKHLSQTGHRMPWMLSVNW
jgi:hypothetical protein